MTPYQNITLIGFWISFALVLAAVFSSRVDAVDKRFPVSVTISSIVYVVCSLAMMVAFWPQPTP